MPHTVILIIEEPDPPEIEFFVIFKKPGHYDDKYVLRRWSNFLPDLIPIALGDTLEELKPLIPKGFKLIPHLEGQSAFIIEVWERA